ncbi:MAG: hypothetical protein KF781_11095 [Chitinophagaceae bacterium]|nr:hypothetical protein [Chitinophagaceae bacterium]MCW5906208.1 hypothetical protein [Chitinophagaceae bacterium]
MKKYVVAFVLFVFITPTTQAQKQQLQEQMFYYSVKGISFIPPLSKPGLVYEGKLYMGRKKLAVLFNQLNDEQLNIYFKKYKANKTVADILSFTGTFALPIANIFITANNGKVNWWLLGAGVLLSGTSNFLNVYAQKNLLMASYYFDKKNGFAFSGFVPQQQSIGLAIPLGK